jgi:hypothetical protein
MIHLGVRFVRPLLVAPLLLLTALFWLALIDQANLLVLALLAVAYLGFCLHEWGWFS